MHRILLLVATRSYRTRAFMQAARRLGATVVTGSERRAAVSRRGAMLTLDLSHPENAVSQIVVAAREQPFDAIIGVDDDTVLVAALASEALGIGANPPDAVRATRDKHLMRTLLQAAAVPGPAFSVVERDGDLAAAAARAPYPCVLKPTFLSASRGVIRADNQGQFLLAAQRIGSILDQPEVADAGGDAARRLLVEAFVPGPEVAVEAMLTDGHLRVLALFDKPDPLDGPFFEETIYLTPSRLPPAEQDRIAAVTARAAAALGLREGPVHAELRISESGPQTIEVAARSIGGLCSSVLEFSGGQSLEELILRHATGAEMADGERQRRPAGVMMIPAPGAGYLCAVEGVDAARAVAGITEVDISIPIGDRIVPVPEGDRYTGFIFARGRSVDDVEQALRMAHAQLHFQLSPMPPAALDAAPPLHVAPA